MKHLVIGLFIIALLVFPLFGCSEGLIVIPDPQGKKVVISNSNLILVSEAMGKTLEKVTRDNNQLGRYYIQLPEGCSDATYKDVMVKLPGNPERLNPDLKKLQKPCYRVAKVVIETEYGEVLIVQPGDDGKPQAVKLYIKADGPPFSWNVIRVRKYNLPFEKVLDIEEVSVDGEKKKPISASKTTTQRAK